MNATILRVPACPGRTHDRIISSVTPLPELLQAARGGDGPARAELVSRFYPRVQALVHGQIQRRLRAGGHGALARMSTGDVVQEVFMEVLRGLDRWEGNEEE